MSEAIWGVTSGLKTMADDTVRITIDINPKYFSEACNNFGKRGIEVALARLVQGTTLEVERQEEEQKPKLKGGELSKLCARFCQSQEFWNYFGQLINATINDDASCTVALKRYLAIDSRAEIDHNETAKQMFHKIRKEYVQYQETVRMAQ